MSDMTVSESVNALFERQLKNWATAASGFAALENVRIKYVEVGPRKEQYKVQSCAYSFKRSKGRLEVHSRAQMLLVCSQSPSGAGRDSCTWEI